MDNYYSPPPQKSCDSGCSKSSGSRIVSTAGRNSSNNYTIDIELRKEDSPTGVIGATNHGGVFFSHSITPVPKKCHQADSTYSRINTFDMIFEITLAESSSVSDRPSVDLPPSNDSLDNVSVKEVYRPSPSVDELGRSIKKLVSIDNIRSPPEEEMLAVLSIEQHENSKSQHEIYGSSPGLSHAPTSWYMGQNSTSSEIRSFKSPKTTAVQVANTYTSNLGDKSSAAEGQIFICGAHAPLIHDPPPIVRLLDFF